MAEARQGVARRGRRLAAGRGFASARISPPISSRRRPSFARRSTTSARRSGIAPSRRKPRSPVSPLFMRDVSPRPSLRRAPCRAAGHGACALRRSRPRSVRSRSRRSACSRKAIFTASGNAEATLAAGCSMIAARTTGGGGAKWKSAAIAPSSGASRRGGARLEASRRRSPDRPHGRRDARRLLAGLGDGPGAALPHGAACAHAARRADRHSHAGARQGRTRAECRLHRRDARRGASEPSRGLPLSRTRTAARIPRSDVVDARRPAPLGSPALCSHPLLAGDAGGPRRRSRAAWRLERPPRRPARPSPMACKWRWMGCRWRRSTRSWRRPIR